MELTNKWPILQDWSAKTLLLIFAGLTVWWIILHFFDSGEASGFQNLIWAASYQILALLGGIWGLAISRLWGGSRSVMGRAIISFAIGLLLQVFGQTVFSSYNLILTVDIPYPSIADIGFFGSIPFYIYGIILLAKSSGAAVSLKSFTHQIQAILIPLGMLLLSYYFFLREYEFEGVGLLQVILDFGYPLGQAIYVSIAILTYLLSRKVLGGVMKNKVLFLLAALVIQYLADYNFLYQAINETWNNGGYGDFIYMIAYLLMALGLIQLKLKYVQATPNRGY